MINRRPITGWLAVVLLALLGRFSVLAQLDAAHAAYVQAPGVEAARDVLVGVNYFAGWWESRPNKWENPSGADWRSEYPARMPLLGEYNTQATMDAEIREAADHGVDFFIILWYPPSLGRANDPHEPPAVDQRLNRGVDYFVASPNAGQMKFLIEYCNKPYGIPNDKEWAECVAVWIKAMGHPSYLRVAGRRVFKIHDGSSAWLEECGHDLAKCRARIDFLRQKARDAGLGELVIDGGNPGRGTALKTDSLFDFASDYMLVPELSPKNEYSYELLADYLVLERHVRRNIPIPYMPVVAAGWDRRPWQDTQTPPFEPASAEQWRKVLLDVAEDLQKNPNWGIPRGDGSCQKAFTIYAWNEFGEGGMVAPTQGDNYLKLDGIKQVFGVKKIE